MKFDESILREADIRGIYPDQVSGEFAHRLGLVFGTYIKKLKETHVVVGHDNRIGGPHLIKELVSGLKETGLNIIYIGLVTTPMLNFACRDLEVEYGVMVTASHNPSSDNGFKLFGKNYQHLEPEELKKVYDALVDPNYKLKKGKGSIDYISVNNKYAKYVADKVEINKKMKVVVDSGNGTASNIVFDVFKYLDNVEPIFIYCDNDPTFPNHHPDPNVKENLIKLGEAVKKNHAHLGVAYDGDADRFGIVDNKGNVIESDQIIALMVKKLLKENDNKKVIIDIKCSNTLVDEIKKYDGEIIMASASSAEQERLIDRDNILFGGGYSNHIFFHDNHPGYDDGVYGGLRFIEFVSKQSYKLSDLPKSLNKYYNTGEIKVKTTDKKKWKIVNGVKKYCKLHNYNFEELDGVKVIFEDGWALLRASNTGPNLTLRFEATKKKRLKQIQNEFMTVLEILQK